jgi:acyl-CoA synthetase (AMP-forming)/AMP-acid ligase II
MSRIESLTTLWAELRAVARVVPQIPRLLPTAPWSPARLLEERAREHGSRPALLFEDRRYSWEEVDREVDRAAGAFRAMGIGPGDMVALLMDNRPEFLFAATGLNRIRAGAALINTNITGHALAHALRIAEPVAVVAGTEHGAKLETVLPEIEGLSKDRGWIQRDGDEASVGGFRSFDELLESQGDQAQADRPLPHADDRFGYIYTSGTTGLPKAALISNQRFLGPGALASRAVFEMTQDDVVYVTTPLYHSVGMLIGWSGALSTGATIALRRKFSASRFWDDVRRFDATVFVYIGELCRYLLNQPERPDDRNHNLRVAGGNGLRPDIWEAFQSRFGIPVIREYYGATEGASMTVNLVGKPGMVGRLLPGNYLLRCDLETGEVKRGADGFCEALGAGETGLLVGRITSANPFDGYADREATKKKVLEDVFKKGDARGPLALVRRPGGRHLPLEGGERLDERGGRAAERRPGRARDECLRRAGARKRRTCRHGQREPRRPLLHRRVRGLRHPRATRLHEALLRAPPARHADHGHVQAPEGRLPAGRLRPLEGGRSALLPGRGPVRPAGWRALPDAAGRTP